MTNTTLSNLDFTNGTYKVTGILGSLSILQPTTSQYVLSYDAELPTTLFVGDNTSNLLVTLDTSNLTINNATSNLFSVSNISPYLQSNFNTLTLNTLNTSLLVGINSNSIVRISNSNELPKAYDNSFIKITASNNVSFKNIAYQPIATVDTPMQFNKPIKATSITCSNITACNIKVLSSNISSASNTATWSSNNLVKRTGDTMSGYLQVSMCNANIVMGSTSNAGAFISLNQGLAMFNSASNYPFYGIGVNDRGEMRIHSYYGLSIGDKDTTSINIKNGNVGIGLSNVSYKLDVAGVVNATGYSGSTITSLSNLAKEKEMLAKANNTCSAVHAPPR
jgi:hypothetical protein